MHQSVTSALGKRSSIAVILAFVCFLTLGLFGYYYIQGKRNAGKPKVETVEKTVIITDNPPYDNVTKQAHKQDSPGEVIYSRRNFPFTIHARNRGSAGMVILHYHLVNAKSSLGIRDWEQLCYFEAGEENEIEFAGLPNIGADGKSIYTVTVRDDFVIISGTVVDSREVFVASCLVLALFLGILGMLFFFRLVQKAAVVNKRISVSKKLIVSVLSSLWVGAILWLLGWYASAVIVRTILDHVNVNFLWDNFFEVNSLIAAALSLVAMIGFGYKVYRRLSAA